MAVIEHVLSVKDMGTSVIATFKDEVSGAVKEASELTKGLAMMGGIAIGLASSYVAMTKEIADFKNEIADASTATGLNISTLQGLDLAARGSGQSLGTLTGALRPFSKRLLDASKGTGEALAGFQALSIESTNLDGSLRSTDEVLKEATAKLAAIEDPTLKAAIATQLFGEAGTSLLVALGDAPLEDFIADAERIGPSFKDGAAGAADLQRAIAELELASLGAADAFATSFGEGEGGLAGMIRSVSDEIGILGTAFGSFFGGLYDDFAATLADIRSLSLQSGIQDFTAAAGEHAIRITDPTRLIDVGLDVGAARESAKAAKERAEIAKRRADRVRREEAEDALATADAAVAATETAQTEEEKRAEAERKREREKAARQRERDAKAAARNREQIAREEARELLRIEQEAERARLQSQQDHTAAVAAETRRRNQAQMAEQDRILAEAAALQAQAAATMAAQASLSSALAFSDPFSTAVAGFQGADAFQADLTAQFGAGLAGVDASGDIAGAANLQRFNAATALGASVMSNFAGVAGKAGAALGSLLTGDALGGFQAGLGGLGAAGAGAIRTGTQVAGAALAVAGGPYGAVAGAAVQLVGDKIADKLEGIFGQLSQALGLTVQVGRLGVGGVQQNLKAFERDFFAGLEALPTILGEVLPKFADSFADQFAEHFPDFAQAMTAEFIDHGPEIGIALAKGFIAGMQQASAEVTADLLSPFVSDGSESFLRRDFQGARDFFSPLVGGGMQRGRGTSGGFLEGLADRGGAMAREGRFGGQRERVIRLEGPGAGHYRDLVRQLNAQLGNQGLRLALGGQ